MMKIRLLLPMALLWFGNAVYADELAFRNGDRLTGELTSVEEGVLSFKTPFGELKAKIEEISGLQMEAPLDVKIGEKTTSMAVKTDEQGAFSIGDSTYTLADIASISPPPAESVRLSEWARWSGSLAASVVWVDGNTHSVDYHGEINLTRDQTQKNEDFKNRLTLHGAYDYGYTNTALTKRHGHGNFKWEVFFSARFGFYVEGSWRYDYEAGIERKNTLGLGVTVKAVDEETLKITLGAGASYLGTFYSDKVLREAKAAGAAVDEFDEYPAFRAFLDVAWKLPLDFEFHHNSSTYKSLLDTDRWQIENVTSLSRKLGGGWFIKLSAVYAYIHPPAYERQRFDATMMLSVVFKF